MVQLRTYGKRRNTERSSNFGILFCRRADRRHQSQKVNLSRLHLGIQRIRKLSLNIVLTLHLPPSFSFWSQESIKTLDSSLTPISAPPLGGEERPYTQKWGSIMCTRDRSTVCDEGKLSASKKRISAWAHAPYYAAPHSDFAGNALSPPFPRTALRRAWKMDFVTLKKKKKEKCCSRRRLPFLGGGSVLPFLEKKFRFFFFLFSAGVKGAGNGGWVGRFFFFARRMSAASRLFFSFCPFAW